MNGKGLSTLLGANYHDEIGTASFREQLTLFSNHSVFILPHGAAETNFFASNSWKDLHTVPTSAILICPPYLHCSCTSEGMVVADGGACSQYYNPTARQDILMTTIIFEDSNKNCDMFCREIANSNMTVKQRRRTFRDLPLLPLVPLATIAHVLQDRIYPRTRQHCLGNAGAHGQETEFRQQTHLVFLNEEECRYSKIPSDSEISAIAAIFDMMLARAYTHATGAQYCGAIGDVPGVVEREISGLAQALGIDAELRIIASKKDSAYQRIDMHRILEPALYGKRDFIRIPYVSLPKKIHNPDFILQTAYHLMVLHIKRNDDSNYHAKPSIQRYISNKYYIELISMYRRNDSRIIVFGDSVSYESYEDFEAVGCEVKVNSPRTDMWRHVMLSDVFVMSASMESYVPAVATSATVIYMPMQLPPLSGWVVVE